MPRTPKSLQIAILTGLLGCSLTATLPGQDPANSTQAPDSGKRISKPIFPPSGNNDVFVLEAETYTLSELIDRSAAFLRCNDLVLWDNPELAGQRSRKQQVDEGERTVTLQTRIAVDRDGCIAVMSQLLGTHGWVRTCVDSTNGMWEWVHLMTSKRTLIATRALTVDKHELNRLRGCQSWVYHTYEPSSLSPRTLHDQLQRPMTIVAQDSSMPPLVVVVGPGILLFGDVPSVTKLRELLVTMDVEPSSPIEISPTEPEPISTREIDRKNLFQKLSREAKRARKQ